MKRKTIVTFLCLGTMMSFFACEEAKDINEEASVRTEFLTKSKVKYKINASIKDINGKYHRFNGEIEFNYDDKGNFLYATFTGYYDGKYLKNAQIILLVQNNKNYGTFDPSVGINDMFENLIETLIENSIEVE